MPVDKPEQWREALKFISRCPVCGAVYESGAGESFAKSGPAEMIHLTCLKCRGHFVALVMSFGQGLSSVGMVTDLSLADARRLCSAEPLSIDEALETCRGLRQAEKEFFASILKV